MWVGLVVLYVSLFLQTTAIRADEGSTDKRRPNVLFIAVDDLNHWVGHLHRNEQTRTPNIDRLAARGITFRHAYCAAPVCNPSRTALMSGMRPSTTGVYNNNHDWRTVVPTDKTLVTQFRNAGYFTAGAGKIYHGSFDRHAEWHDYLQKEGGGAESKVDGGVGGIKFAPLDCRDDQLGDWNIVNYGIEQLGKKHDKPFFLCVGMHKPHMPWNVPKKYFDMFPLESIQLPPTKPGDLDDIPEAGKRMAGSNGDHAAILKSGRWKEAVQAYLATIAYCDMNVGRLLDAFEKSAYRDNTIIVFWGDHGWHLGEKEHWRKFALWEEATRAPFIWSVPGVTKAGGACDRTVDFMSIYPTLCDLCGIAIPKHVEGTSLRPLLADPAAEWDRPALTTHGFKNHAVRSESFRFIRYADGGEELYDEAADPFEWTNVVSNARHAATKALLEKSLPTKNQPELDKTEASKRDGKNKGKNKKSNADAQTGSQ